MPLNQTPRRRWVVEAAVADAAEQRGTWMHRHGDQNQG